MAQIPEQLPGSGVLHCPQTIPGLDKNIVLLHTITTIGRHPNNHITVPLNTISRFHGRVRRDGLKYYVEDLNSSNGTFVNDEAIVHQELHNEDKVAFGDATFIFFLDEERSKSSSTHAGQASSVKIEQDSFENAAPDIITAEVLNDPETLMRQIESLDSVDKAAYFLKTHYRLLDIIRHQPRQDRLLQNFLELMFEVLNAQRGVIMLTDGVTKQLKPECVVLDKDLSIEDEVSMSQTIVDECVSKRMAILCSNAIQDERFSKSESVLDLGVLSVICVPLILHSKVFGICYLDSRRSTDAFSKDDLYFVSNLTSQVAMAIENQRMAKQRLHAEQLAVIGQTMSEISHSIKNVLAVTQTGAELMDYHLAHNNLESAKKTWASIHVGMDRVNNLVAAMLDYSRTPEYKPSEVQINDVIKLAYDDTLAKFQKKGIVYTMEIDQALQTCWVDSDGIFDAIMNLLMNAFDAVQNIEKPEIRIISEALSSEEIQLTVRDNGMGISENLIERIFLPFFTTKGSEGNGMGLAMVKKFSREMDGDAQVKSIIGEGTWLSVILPTYLDA